MLRAGKRPFWLLVAGLLALVSGTAQAEETTCGVKYISAEHVYLDAGSAAGLTVGLAARVVRGPDTIAVLEVVFTAEYSASCKVLSTTAEILPGDTVVYDAVEVAQAPEVGAAVAVPVRTRQVESPVSRPVAQPGPRLSGYVAAQWDHLDDATDRDRSSNFLRVPFRVRVSGLAGGTEFRARGSFRHTWRSGYSSATPASQWRNRIQTVAWGRDDRRQNFHFAVGRIGTRYTASAGSFDGFSLNFGLGNNFRLGAFSGFSPDWSSMEFSTDNVLAGVNFNYNLRTSGGAYLDVILAGIGRYNQGDVSREYLAMTTSWRSGARLSLLQAAELDFNRDWRKTENSSTVELTSLALTGRYQVSSQVAVNLGYDNREPVRTWESRSLPDSLFTDAGRTGWRAGLGWRGNSGQNLTLWGSLRDQDGDGGQTTSWNGSFFLPRLTGAALDLRLALRGFDGPYLSGWSPTLGLAKSALTSLRLSLEGGYYVYSDGGNLPDRDNIWVAATAAWEFAARWSTQAEYRRDWGDDIRGNRLFLELRYRF